MSQYIKGSYFSSMVEPMRIPEVSAVASPPPHPEFCITVNIEQPLRYTVSLKA
jgi:hypothetical protein